MNTAAPIAPPPPARRTRPLQAEPVVFAVALMLLTLGINLQQPAERSPTVKAQAATAQVAAAR